MLRFVRLQLDGAARSLRVDGQLVDLTRSEFELPQRLMSRPRRVFSGAELLAHLRTPPPARNAPSACICATCGSRSQVKIEAEPARPRRLETVFGVGHRCNPGEEA